MFVPIIKIDEKKEDFIPVKKLNEKTGVWTSIKEDLKANWPQYAGATLGSITGIPGGFPGMIGGAAFGGAAGEAYKQLGQHLGKPEEAPQTPTEAARRIATEGLKQAVYEATSGAIMKVMGKVLAPFKKTVTAEAKTAFNTLQKYMPKKIPSLLPAEMTKHRGLEVLHNIAGKSAIGGHKIADFKNVIREKAIEDMVDDLANSFGKQVDPDVLGNTVVDVIQSKFKKFEDTITTPLYNTVAKMTTEKEVKIPLSKLKDSVAKQIEKVSQLKGIASESAGDNMIKAIKELPDVVDFATAQDLRSRLLSIADEFSITNKRAPAIGLANKLRNELDEIINVSLKQQNKRAHAVWRQANEIYKRGTQKYNNRFIRQLIKQAKNEPERVLRSIFKNGGITGIKRTKEIVGEETWKTLKSWYVRDLINKSTSKEGIVDGRTLLMRMYSHTSGMGKEAIRQIFTKSEQENIRAVALALKVAQTRQAEGEGGMLIKLLQAGALTNLIFRPGQLTSPSVVLLMGPEILSRMMLNPISSKWLSVGLKAPKGSRLAVSTALRLSGIANKIENKIKKEKESSTIKEEKQNGINTYTYGIYR